jgi:site-specific DNA recombinase
LRAYHGEIADADWPAIVDRDVFEAARVILTNPARAHKPRNGYGRQHKLSGLARCGKCGAAMSSSANRKKRSIYVCRACEVDAWVIGHVVDRLSRQDAAELTINEKRADLPDLLAQEEELLERQRALRPMLSNPKIPTAMVEEAFAEIDAKLAEIAAKLSDGNDSHVLRDLVPAGGTEREKFNALSYDERCDIQRRKFDGLTLDRQRAVVDRLMTITIHPGQPATGGFRDDLVVVKPKA